MLSRKHFSLIVGAVGAIALIFLISYVVMVNVRLNETREKLNTVVFEKEGLQQEVEKLRAEKDDLDYMLRVKKDENRALKSNLERERESSRQKKKKVEDLEKELARRQQLYEDEKKQRTDLVVEMVKLRDVSNRLLKSDVVAMSIDEHLFPGRQGESLAELAVEQGDLFGRDGSGRR